MRTFLNIDLIYQSIFYEGFHLLVVCAASMQMFSPTLCFALRANDFCCYFLPVVLCFCGNTWWWCLTQTFSPTYLTHGLQLFGLDIPRQKSQQASHLSVLFIFRITRRLAVQFYVIISRAGITVYIESISLSSAGRPRVSRIRFVVQLRFLEEKSSSHLIFRLLVRHLSA